MEEQRTWNRRRFLAGGLGGVVAVFGLGELVEHGVLPGKVRLEHLLGDCSVSTPALTYAAPGRTLAGAFHSKARGRSVGYTIAYPPNHAPGSKLPLVVYLHADGGNHTSPLGGVSLAEALAASHGG